MREPYGIRIGTHGMPDVVFAHGWDRSHRDFIPVAELVAPFANSLILDLPGFGESSRPEGAWGSRAYADYLKRVLNDSWGIEKCMWVGHSFGGRIGFCMAAASDGMVGHLVVVAGAGLPRRLSLRERVWRYWRGLYFRLARLCVDSEDRLVALEKRYGSVDYVRSRETGMRDILISVLNENLLPEIKQISCPTSLIYGGLDTETPPETGRRLHMLISGSEYVECSAFDHMSILNRGRHQVAAVIRDHLVRSKG